VIFSVTKAKRGREFTASTRDYVVHVVGTVFMLTPLERGRCAVRVIEGMVRIEGPGISAVVSAGNTFGFDDQAGAYVSKSSLTAQTYVKVPHLPQDTTAVGLKPKPQFRFVARNVPLVRDSLLDRASGLEATDWEQSIQTYRAILDRPGVSPVCREIALFSIGRLLADHNAPATSARDAFITTSNIETTLRRHWNGMKNICRSSLPQKTPQRRNTRSGSFTLKKRRMPGPWKCSPALSGMRRIIPPTLWPPYKGSWTTPEIPSPPPALCL
jgi:hypothetical protein